MVHTADELAPSPTLLLLWLWEAAPRGCFVPHISSSGSLAEPGGIREALSHLQPALRQLAEQEGFICFAQIELFATKHQSVATESRDKI